MLCVGREGLTSISPVVKSCIKLLSSRVSSRLRFFSSPASPAYSTNNQDHVIPQVVFSGIQPTGIPHLGNYLGALRQWVDLQNTSPPSTVLLFCIVDLHSLTMTNSQTPSQLRQYRHDMLTTFLACGLDPSRSIIFNQSSVPEHSELHWILSTDASMGSLSRMTQWKAKTSASFSSLPSTSDPIGAGTSARLGLFSYPVLQAADILLYNTTHVPVGADQIQHVEFARELALRFNGRHAPEDAPILTIPTHTVTSSPRIMSLTKPESKMSKSADEPNSRILLTDPPDVVRVKVKKAVTDSAPGVTYDPECRPGVSNLLELICLLSKGQQRSPEDVAFEFDNRAAGGQSPLKFLKEEATRLVNAELAPIQERFRELLSGDGREGGSERAAARMREIVDEGASRARQRARATMERVKDAVGL